ncbi:heme-binding protein [Novosphingobium sp. BL-8A]|uniref:heme-binding protein n=1 Tax=Novosphingobium sp. BL-8A TaxID=3127639 RepID=UPI003756DC33
MIELAQARQVIAGARAKGREMGLNPLTVVVLDPGGHLVAIEREDKSGFGRPKVALGKAAGALAIGISYPSGGSRLVDEVRDRS